jgi:hypothetical protein
VTRRTLVRVTPSHRRAAAALAFTCLATLAATGCSRNFDAVMSKREVVVVFSADAGRATQERVRASCAKVSPRTVPEPMPTTDSGINRRYGVRFRVDQASDQDLNKLYACLKKDKAVVGVNSPDDDN